MILEKFSLVSSFDSSCENGNAGVFNFNTSFFTISLIFCPLLTLNIANVGVSTAAIGGYAIQMMATDCKSQYFNEDCTDGERADCMQSWFGNALLQNALIGSVYFQTDDQDTKNKILMVRSHAMILQSVFSQYFCS